MITITNDFKLKIIDALRVGETNFGGSASKYATSLGINSSVLSQLKKGKTERLLNEGSWVSLGRQLGISISDKAQWKVAETPVFTYITEQLRICQDEAISTAICDLPDIGKTESAKWYVKNNPNSVRIDCSQVPTDQLLIRAIAKEFGLESGGRFNDVYQTLAYYINMIPAPLIVLDEAGHLVDKSAHRIISLWNATDGHCGWCVMGADGLRAKWEANRDRKKVGFAELISRFGGTFNRITPEGHDAQVEFRTAQAALIIQANAPQINVREVLAKSQLSLRKVKTELKKRKK